MITCKFGTRIRVAKMPLPRRRERVILSELEKLLHDLRDPVVAGDRPSQAFREPPDRTDRWGKHSQLSPSLYA
ncbi:unnamed protein product, partial [Mycena citricolor]